MIKNLNAYDLSLFLFIFFKIGGIGPFIGFSWWWMLVPITLEILHNIYLYFAITKGWQRNTLMLIMAKMFNAYWDYKRSKVVKTYIKDDKTKNPY